MAQTEQPIRHTGEQPLEEQRIYIYSRFERFWHWVQALFIIVLLLTGFELHGTFVLFGYHTAFYIHNGTAWAWLILYAFIIFWMLTTGEWRQYVPTFKKMVDVGVYYCSGIFRGEPHPVPKTARIKHNPLQRLTYLGIVVVLVPFQIITGFLFYYYSDWGLWGFDWSLIVIAGLHIAGAFAMLAFLVVHIYMTTTGHSVFTHTKAMFTGWETVADLRQHEWEKKEQPTH